MYKFVNPKPIIIKLTDEIGFELRKKAADYISENQNKSGAERGSKDEQGFGALAEIVIRKNLGMPEINNADHPLAYDLLLPSGVKVDVKCRGGSLPFREEYISNDGLPREAKHNLFARQIYDDRLDTDIYLMTHLETPKDRALPGTKRQKKWILYICGWVSKERVEREGVFLPRGSLTEQGNTWFTYRGQEIEFYHKNLNGLEDIKCLAQINKEDVEKDKNIIGDLNLTSVDALRIAYDLVGRGIIDRKYIDFVKEKVKISGVVKPILHVNQYYHFLNWLKQNGQITDKEINNLEQIIQKVDYMGI